MLAAESVLLGIVLVLLIRLQRNSVLAVEAGLGNWCETDRHLHEAQRRTMCQEDGDCCKIGFVNSQAPALIRMIY